MKDGLFFGELISGRRRSSPGSYNIELSLHTSFTVNTRPVPVSPLTICVDLGKALKHRFAASVSSSVTWEQ